MKSIFNLILALSILVIFGGTGYFLLDISKGTKFERSPVTPLGTSSNSPASPDSSDDSEDSESSPE